ncbi:Protein of unknown function [Gryllus bimaculatus]|nr:Protein of unknown function [Gryllus bimaculatus]
MFSNYSWRDKAVVRNQIEEELGSTKERRECFVERDTQGIVASTSQRGSLLKMDNRPSFLVGTLDAATKGYNNMICRTEK